MTAEELLQELGRQPFIPFRLHLSTGQTIDVLYSNTAWVRLNTVLIVHPLERGTCRIGRYDVIALHLIERIEQIPERAAG